MGNTPEEAKIRLPRNWRLSVKAAVLHVVSLAQYATVYTRSWAADSSNARMRLTAENQGLALGKRSAARRVAHQKRSYGSNVARTTRPSNAWPSSNSRRREHSRSSRQATRSSSRRKPSPHGSGEWTKTAPTRSCKLASRSIASPASCAFPLSGRRIRLPQSSPWYFQYLDFSWLVAEASSFSGTSEAALKTENQVRPQRSCLTKATHHSRCQ